MNNQTKTKGKTYAIINLIFYSFFLIFLITYLVLEIKYKPAKSLLKILEEYKKPGDYEFLKPFTNIQNWYFAFSKFLLFFLILLGLSCFILSITMIVITKIENLKISYIFIVLGIIMLNPFLILGLIYYLVKIKK